MPMILLFACFRFEVCGLWNRACRSRIWCIL